MIYQGRKATIIDMYQAPLIELKKAYGTKFSDFNHLLKEKDWDNLQSILDYSIFIDEEMKSFLGGDVTGGLITKGKPQYQEIDILGVSAHKDELINELKAWQARMNSRDHKSFSLEQLSIESIGKSNGFIYAVDNILRFGFPSRKLKTEAFNEVEHLDVPTSPINFHLLSKKNFEKMVEEGQIFYRG